MKITEIEKIYDDWMNDSTIVNTVFTLDNGVKVEFDGWTPTSTYLGDLKVILETTGDYVIVGRYLDISRIIKVEFVHE